MDNIPADVLSRLNQHIENKAGQQVGRHGMAGASVAHAIRTWMSLVAKYVNSDECVTAAIERLSRGLPLASFGCTKCGASHMHLPRYT